MARNSKISWTDATFNPWMGCTKFSPGCDNCYAERERNSRGLKLWGVGVPRQKTSVAYWKKPLQWDKQAKAEGKRVKVFCGSLCDWLDTEVPNAWRHELLKLIEATPNLDWLLLTKRAEFLDLYHNWFRQNRNAWCGVTMENQKTVEHRTPYLLAVPAVVRFISAEPLLEQIDLSWATSGTDYSTIPPFRPVDWVIIGGESGAKARPFNLEWARILLRKHQGGATKIFVKQFGNNFHDGYGFLNVRAYPDWAKKLGRDVTEKVKDMANWPKEFQVQEFPEVRR